MFGKKIFCRSLAVFQIISLLTIFSPHAFAQKKGKDRPLVPETVFSNSTSITIGTSAGLTTPTVAATYPSQVTVSGMLGNTTRVAVNLNGLTHPNLSHLDFLLVSPAGGKYIFASDMGGGGGVNDKFLTFADDAANIFPAFSLDAQWGPYRPTTGDSSGDTFPAPAPAGPYTFPFTSTFASSFNGGSPNGAWSLYVVDDVLSTAGSLNEGWSLTITTDSAAATTFENTAYVEINDMTVRSTPYGTQINVSGMSGVISNMKVMLNGFSHTVPQDVDIMLVSPDGRGLVVMSDAGGNVPASGANITIDDAASIPISSPIVTGSYTPADATISGEVDTFQRPAPARLAYGSGPLATFNGVNPNGTWTLFVVDDTQNNSGSISGGWSLDITTVPTPPPTPASCVTPAFSPSNLSVGINPTNVAIADLNNDSNADLAITNQTSNDVSILLGNGSGAFTPQTPLTAGSGPYAVAAGLFNADSNVDLAVANSTSNNVSILLGNGNGTFSSATNFFAGSGPISLATGDFNNDTKADLAVANFGGFFIGSVSILLGNGSGGFTAGTSVRTRTQPSYVAVTSISGDANQDLVVANFGSDSVSTFFGDGSGAFSLNQNISTGSGPVAVEVANFQGSSFPDIAIANFSSDSITTCSGAAGGSFSGCATNPAGGSNPVSIAAGNFALSGNNNLAFALSGTNQVRVLTSNITVGQNPNAVETGDFNNDSRPDLVSVNSSSNDISIMLNICQVAKGNRFDFNGDRKTDYTVFRPTGVPSWWVSPSPSPKILFRPTDQLVPADYNGDLLTDYAIYRPDEGLWFVIANNNDPLYFIEFGIPGDIPVPADYDGDGKTDIAVWRPSDGNWFVRQSSDHATAVYNLGLAADLPAPVDYDGDGKADIAVFRPSTGVWYIFRSSDSQFFIVPFGLTGDKIVPADYDGDGSADIAIWRPSSGSWYVLRSSDSGVQAANWGLPADQPVLGDYDGDGKFDYAVRRSSDNIWYVLKSSDGAPIFTQWGISTDIPIPNAYVR